MEIFTRDPNLSLVVATLFIGLGLISLLSGWANNRFSTIGFLLSLASIGLFVLVHRESPLTLVSVPEAVIDIIARLIR